MTAKQTMLSASLLVDRFISASSADDARDSLQGIVFALQAKDSDNYLDPAAVWNEVEALEALLEVLVTGEHKGISLDQGPPLVCQVYTELINARDSTVVLHKPQRGRLVQSLIDVICNSDDSTYARVSALQLMRKICSKFPSVAQTQLLEVPNGLHRLADMIGEDNEQVRNEALLLAKVIAQWPSCAKIWVFADVCDSVIELAVQEGGLTNGHVLVMDCIDLLYSLLKHDPLLADLVCQSAVFAKKLSSLLDLRRGAEFLNPKVSSSSDDLDDILQAGRDQTKGGLPRLTFDEEVLLGKVIDLIGVVLSSESARRTMWTHQPALGSLLWELALLSPPPIGAPSVCAVPSIYLQQMALNCISESFASVDTMNRHNGLDRLLYLVCTGGSSEKFEEKLGLSQSALHVIRKTLPDDAAKEILMHTLAPPTSDDSADSEPTVVRKLVNTAVENLAGGSDLDRRKINLLGSLGALSLFMRDPTSREMLLRITAPRSLVDGMLKSLETEDDVISLTFLRFLSEWVIESPAIVEAILSSTQSPSLGVLFGSVGPKAVLSGLLLGIAMEYMDDQGGGKYGGWSRSSILSMTLNRKGGISGFMSDLEELKTVQLHWKACPLEETTFLDWYNAQVLLVRGRILKELTGGDGGERDDNDDEDKGPCSKALHKLVTQQSHELLELREALALTKNELRSKESELNVWTRRLESAPTQLDSMLSEYATKNMQLERDVTALHKELECLRDMNEVRLKENEDEIIKLRRELEICYESSEGAARDTDRLRGELSALSTAYSNLEEEYNRLLSLNPAGAPVGVFDGAEAGGRQPEGEVSSQGHAGSEVEDLRAENARLRIDARAADEWMQLAHQRMGEIGSQNLELLQEVASLKETLNSDKSPDGHDSVEEELQQVRERCSALEAEIAVLLANDAGIEMMDGEGHEALQKKGAELKRAATNSRGEPNSSEDSMIRQIAELKTELQLARANATALNEEKRQLEMEVSSRLSTEGELVKRLQSDLEAKHHESDSLRNRIETLQQQLTESKSSLGLSLAQSENPGEAVLVLPRTQEEEFKQLQELEHLRAANLAAHKWIEQAVEHHRMLTDKVAALEKDGEQLQEQFTLAKTNQTSEELGVAGSQREGAGNMEGSGLDYADGSAEGQALHRGGQGVLSNELEDELQELRVVRVELDAMCSSQKLKIEDLQRQLLASTEERNRRSLEIGEIAAKLNEYEKEAESSQEKELVLQVEALNSENKELKVRLETLQRKLVSDVSELEYELEEQRRLVSVTNARLSQAKAEHEDLESSSLTLIKQWQERAEDLDATNEELNKMLEINALASSDTITKLQQRILELESKIECLEKELEDTSLEEVAELEEKIRALDLSLETKREEGVKAVEIWSLRFTELSDAMNILKADHDALSKEKEVIETAARDLEDMIENERALNESLSMQIHAMDKELSSTRLSLVKVSDEGERTAEALQGEIDLQAETVRAHEASVITLQKLVDELRSEVNAVQSAAKQSVEVAQVQNQELEAALASAKEKLEMREHEAIAALTVWESHTKVLEDERLNLCGELNVVKAAKEALEARESALANELDIERGDRLIADKAISDAHSEIDSLVKQSEEAIAQWQDVVAELESQLVRQQEEAIDAIAQWEGEYDKLQARMKDVELANDELARVISDALRTLQKKQWRWIQMLVDDALPDELEIIGDAELGEIPSHLSHMAEFNDAIIVTRIKDFMSKASSHLERSHLLEETLKSRDSDLAKLKKDLADLTSLSADKDVLCTKLKEECSEMESILSSERNVSTAFKLEMEDRTNEMQGQLQKYEATTKRLRSQLESSDKEIGEVSRAKVELEQGNEALKRNLLEAELALSDVRALLEDAIAERSKVESALKLEHQLRAEIETKWETSKKEKHELEISHLERCTFLEGEVARLEDELRATSEVLQGHITDELSRRATDMATYALRDEIELLRSRNDGGQDALLEERRARLAAEGEIASLKSDLAMMFRLQDDGGDSDYVKSMVLKLADESQQKELQEIDELRMALESVLRELDAARAAEVEAAHRAARADLQASICEQEAIGAKCDVAFLSQSFEETREAEAARVASFEYRVSALEEDRDIVRRFHADELETLRHELSHCSMEKDRILHSLKESEKTNAALVYSASREIEGDDSLQPENELSKLRASNTQLLTSAAEEAARTERRLREAIVASASLVEAEVLVEREIRVAAETALENVKSQLNEAQGSHLEQPARSDTLTASPDRLQTQLSQARDQSRRLESENLSLRNELDNLKAEVEREMADLTDRCQRAQCWALKLEREAKICSQVESEAQTFHHLRGKATADTWVLVSETTSKPDGVSSIEAFDFIAEQKAAIQEERQLYLELLSEHDDLLALLAQQDLEKASLHEALMNLGGHNVVKAAIQKAELNAVERFGTYVRLS